jgi:hypothetical protein
VQVSGVAGSVTARFWHDDPAGGCSAAVFLGIAEMRGILLPIRGRSFANARRHL